VDLAVVVVSANDARWLPACLSSVYAHAGAIALEAIVVDNASTDGTRELVQDRFPDVKVVSSPNLGFAYGNNRGLAHTRARYVLLLNPDTEVIEGTLADVVATLDAQPEVGVAGVRQVGTHGELLPTIRRFPNALRALAEALGCERWPVLPWAGERLWPGAGERLRAGAGERVLDPAVYARASDCDWVVGSFLLARREALLAAGLLDERFFLYSEEPDLCLRVARAGWRVRHLPCITIRHHAGKGGVRPRMVAQEAFARRQYARKHFSAAHRALYLGALGVRYGLRGRVSALRALSRRAAPPFLVPPPTALSAAPLQAPARDARCCEEAST
jgi:N-acetylglucosaminyl-diphospho-decaprenol L-rhamnosyltransferase